MITRTGTVTYPEAAYLRNGFRYPLAAVAGSPVEDLVAAAKAKMPPDEARWEVFAVVNNRWDCIAICLNGQWL